MFLEFGALAISNSFGGGSATFVGLLVALVVGGLFYIAGIIVAGQGQVLRATLDSAVSHSPFLLPKWLKQWVSSASDMRCNELLS